MLRGFSPPLKRKSVLAPIALKAAAVGKGRHIILVTDCSMIGGSQYPLAERLHSDGWRVTILDITKPGVAGRNFKDCGYHRLAGTFNETNWYIQMQSLTAYHWLRDRTCDAIIFHHGFAAAFYSCMARIQGLAFQNIPVLVCAGETHAMELERSFQLPSGRHDFETDYMERRSFELADGAVCGPAAGEFMQETGWVFPKVAGVIKEKGPVALSHWIMQLVAKAHSGKTAKQKPPFISVCIATYNRARLLREVLKSLEGQTVKNFEVIVVNDGSTDTSVEKLHKELSGIFKKRKWKWVKQKNAGPAVARNNAAKQAKGQYLLFIDDDDIAYPDEIERFSLAARSGADIIGCILGMHPETENGFPPTAWLPEREGKGTRPVGWTPIGGNSGLTAFINVAAFAHSLFKRTVFKKLGGFPVHKDAVFEDFELATKALIAGCRIDVVPEVLMLYRRTKDSRSMGQDIFEGHLHSLQLLTEHLPPALRPLLMPLRNEWYQRHQKRRDGEV